MTELVIILPFHLYENRPYLDLALSSIAEQGLNPETTKLVLVSSAEGSHIDLPSPGIPCEVAFRRDLGSIGSKMNFVFRNYQADSYLFASDDIIFGRDAIKEMVMQSKMFQCVVNPTSNCDDITMLMPKFKLSADYETTFPEDLTNFTEERFKLICNYKPVSELPHVLRPTRLKMFATLFPKYVIDSVGLIDERYDSGWEDVDYWVRCRELNVHPIVTTRAYVHHFGGKTCDKKPTDIMENNQRLYQEKWKDNSLAMLAYL